jgi:hypothetical protein
VVRLLGAARQGAVAKKGEVVMPKMPGHIIPAQRQPAKMTKIKARDDFCVLRRKKSPQVEIFFMREPDGGTIVVWSGDDDLEVTSFGSAKERREAFARDLKKKRASSLSGK